MVKGPSPLKSNSIIFSMSIEHFPYLIYFSKVFFRGKTGEVEVN